MPSPARRLEKRPSLDSLVARVDAQRPGEVTGDTIATGFGSLDKLLGGGLRRRDLILLGGDIGSGKSAFALGVRVARQAAWRRSQAPRLDLARWRHRQRQVGVRPRGRAPSGTAIGRIGRRVLVGRDE